MERPCIAARILSFRLVASSRFRMVMLAMQSMIALRSLIATPKIALLRPPRTAHAGLGLPNLASHPSDAQNVDSKGVPMVARSARSRNSFIPRHIHSP
jgi:hypothetical protein